MAIVDSPSADPRDQAEFGKIPQNTELEAALLGILLYDNEAYHRIEGLEPTHFYEPIHGVIYAEIQKDISGGRLVDPLLINDRLEPHSAYQQLGGLRYLADLFDRAPPAAHAADYANSIRDLAARRELIRVAGEAMVIARPGYSELTGHELIEAVEQQLFAIAETGAAQGGFKTFSHYLAGAVEQTAIAYQRDGSVSGLATGLTDLDQRLGGLHPSDLVIIAGRPSMGKTALATNIAFNIAKRHALQTGAGGVVGFFSAEMAGEQLALRILAETSGVPSDRMRRGDIQPHEYDRIRDGAALIQNSPLHIDDTGGLSIAKLATRARRMKRTTGLDLIVVDYLQLLTTDRRSGREENRVQQIGEITGGLKALAKELGVPVVALSQLSRQVENREDKRPQLADLRESGSIEQDADVVMFVYREAYYLGRTEPKAGTPEHFSWLEKLDACRSVAEVIIGKQRHGPTGTVRLHFNDELTRFTTLARESYSQSQMPLGAARD